MECGVLLDDGKTKKNGGKRVRDRERERMMETELFYRTATTP